MQRSGGRSASGRQQPGRSLAASTGYEVTWNPALSLPRGARRGPPEHGSTRRGRIRYEASALGQPWTAIDDVHLQARTSPNETCYVAEGAPGVAVASVERVSEVKRMSGPSERTGVGTSECRASDRGPSSGGPRMAVDLEAKLGAFRGSGGRGRLGWSRVMPAHGIFGLAAYGAAHCFSQLRCEAPQEPISNVRDGAPSSARDHDQAARFASDTSHRLHVPSRVDLRTRRPLTIRSANVSLVARDATGVASAPRGGALPR